MEVEHVRTNKHCVIESVPSVSLFNLPLSKYYWLLDCRGKDEFDASRIGLPFFFPPPAQDLESSSFLQLLSEVAVAFLNDFGCPDYMNPVVLYGDTSEASMRHVQRVAQFLQAWINSDKNGDDISLCTDESLQDFLSKLKYNTRQIWILQGGIDAMKRDYPILVLDRKPSEGNSSEVLSTLPPLTPLHLSQRLFLGRSAFKLTQKNLNGLRIAHVLLCNSNSSFSLGNQAREPIPGVAYYTCDKPNEDYNDSLKQTFQFALCVFLEIESKKKLEGECDQDRILIQLQGRSSSLTGYDNLSACIAVLLLFLIQWPELIPVIRSRMDSAKGGSDDTLEYSNSMEIQASTNSSSRLLEKFRKSVAEICDSIANLCGARFSWDDRYTSVLLQYLADYVGT